ncbi:MAG: phosphoribosylformylglycinamidine synthase subunit PurL [Methanobrevibacter sp.]|jgi:phosphoribosylformylglycinamidine synthase|nr:phosphoribosylformylglycinamidine synthase subunit PurL [Candidatus Methanovirga basalitermitum]
MLTDSEMEYIVEKIGRVPNPLEEGMLDIMFSEHCSYKSSRPFLKMFPTAGENIIMGPGDDAGIVSITDELALAVGIESHNHPSAIEPYGGAGTGIGGILRDIISMGAMPIALLNSLHFGLLKDQKSRYLFEHVVKGISDYGNRVGVPTVGGELVFDDSYKTNPLVNVMCVGLLHKNDIVKGIAPDPGDVFLLMGSTTGRDGIHGVTFASIELTKDSEIDDRPAVQVGDPFTKKKVLEASLEILEKLNVSGVKDLGGGGLTCCISELVYKCNNGAEIDLNKIPLRENEMTPYEIMLSESQERMVFVINPEYIDEVVAICNKYEIPSAVIGKVTEGDKMIVKDDNEIIANLPSHLLADPPYINREIREPKDNIEYVEIKNIDTEEAILKLSSDPNIGSKKWVYKQYDHEVQIRTVVKPGDDAAVLNIDDETFIALNCDTNSSYTKLSPYHGGAGCVSEAVRNIVSMGAKPCVLVDCLNFGNPENPEVLWSFSKCIEGMSDIANSFKTSIISGNVSFYNETEDIRINPTSVVGAIGVGKIKNIRTLNFKNEGDKIIAIGTTYDEVNGSIYHKTCFGLEQGHPPKIRIENEKEINDEILRLLDEDINNNITAVHDCSGGGVGVCLTEMAIAGGLGCVVEIAKLAHDKNIDLNNLLFSESHGRYLITVKGDCFESILEDIKVPCSCIGEVKGDKLKIVDGDISIGVSKLDENYNNAIGNYME